MRALLPALVLIMATACSDQTPTTANDTAPAGHAALPQQEAQALHQAARSVWAHSAVLLEQVNAAASQLDQSVQALLANPSTETLNAARMAWQQCHEQWLSLSYQWAIAQGHPAQFAQLDQLIDEVGGWPIQPGYLDYYDVYRQSGLVNDISIAITARNIHKVHQQFDPDERALGLHAIAYLLWGEKGERPVEDFLLSTTQETAESAPRADELPNNRRRALLALQTNLLIDDLRALAQQWQANTPTQLAFNRQSAQQASELLRAGAIYLIKQQLIEQQLKHQSTPENGAQPTQPFGPHAAAEAQHQLHSLAQLSRPEARPLLADWGMDSPEDWGNDLAVAERSLQKLAQNATDSQRIATIAALQTLANQIQSADVVEDQENR